jgi:hypothetical protein
MNTNERGLVARRDISHSQHHALLDLIAIGAFKSEDTEVPEPAGKISFRYFGDHCSTLLSL